MKLITWGDEATGRALMLANMGIAVKTIAESTGLSQNQIRYRMQRAGIRLGDYRYGKSRLSRWLAHCAISAAKSRLRGMTPTMIGPSTLNDHKPLIKMWKSTRGLENL